MMCRDPNQKARFESPSGFLTSSKHNRGPTSKLVLIEIDPDGTIEN